MIENDRRLFDQYPETGLVSLYSNGEFVCMRLTTPTGNGFIGRFGVQLEYTPAEPIHLHNLTVEFKQFGSMRVVPVTGEIHAKAGEKIFVGISQ